MSDAALLERAAGCYLRSGLPTEAARCLREAGAFRRSAELCRELGEFLGAAEDYVCADMMDVAAWVLVHEAGDAPAARAVAVCAPPSLRTGLGSGEWTGAAVRVTQSRSAQRRSAAEQEARESSLRMRLALARCDVAEGRSDREPLAALAAAAVFLGSHSLVYDRLVEQWGVATAESMRRYDQVALLFAASVRGRRGGAARRWTEWAARVLQSEITIPDLPSDDRRQAVRALRQG
ncbi:hypothetical protein J7I98_30875 [Streptomyces sp. ISL-98]|uniref:hypothetical protein n=1 Tax=Streptomyces sp. ISL-98 TaxID=2819192 RepID=UPI001BEA735E|nr:hypothetical protein [Streptomyces sp. ISL-98]MBT2510181.1 hypothetical protein [Streptomyces sp. ISL-98]